jgi:NAD(P)-dependent dehydrogenase (short-subunit alcohol dehydrogenase family)
VKTLLLTGASGGIGRQLLAGLSHAGYNLALHANAHTDKLREAAANLPTRIEIYRADLSSEAEIHTMAEAVLQAFGHIDVLVNNAGIGLGNISWKESAEQWNKVLAINLTAPFLLCKQMVPHMREANFGRIINISSVVASIGMPGTTAYAASKAGLEGFTRSLAKEVIGKNITANCIAYGYMEAGMIDVLSIPQQSEILKLIPAGKFGPVQDILSAILYLADEKSTYITGQTLHINGGMFG